MSPLYNLSVSGSVINRDTVLSPKALLLLAVAHKPSRIYLSGMLRFCLLCQMCQSWAVKQGFLCCWSICWFFQFFHSLTYHTKLQHSPQTNKDWTAFKVQQQQQQLGLCKFNFTFLKSKCKPFEKAWSVSQNLTCPSILPLIHPFINAAISDNKWLLHPNH